MSEHRRYQLRTAAGKYWLLDMEQSPENYRAPLAMNETGALILETYWKTGDQEKTAAMLQETYGIDPEDALTDVRDFLESLHLEE